MSDTLGDVIQTPPSPSFKGEAAKTRPSFKGDAVKYKVDDRDDLHVPGSGLHTLSTPEASQQWQHCVSELEARTRRARDRFGENFVISQGNPFRTFWSILVVMLLVYTGTFFVGRLSFIELRIPLPDEIEMANGNGTLTATAEDEDKGGWQVIDEVVTVIFWLDLVVNFFFTYEDDDGREVRSLRCIARNYLSKYFIVDVIACIPEELLKEIFEATDLAAPQTVNQGAKALRLQRITRLARLMRLTRLAKVAAQMRGPVFMWFRKQKGFRVINLSGMLAWVMHILACGWYVCAALHDNALDTWVARRTVDGAGEIMLLERGPFDQWMQSMYFILTVFTTVGFGDMSAMTNGEIVYVCFTMLIGAVVHSVIVGEVIRVVTSNDQTKLFVQKKTELVEAFAQHTELSDEAAQEMSSWVSMCAKFWMSHKYNRDEMRELIVGRYMPRPMLHQLPHELFQGKLCRNRLFTCSRAVCSLPPRLPMILALACQKAAFEANEIIYNTHEYAVSMYLVLSGTFAHVAHASPEGGYNHKGGLDYRSVTKTDLHNHRATSQQVVNNEPVLQPYSLFSHGSYFGEVELFLNCVRKTTARCESESGGFLLCVHKTDFKQVADEFPQFGALWQHAAKRHDWVQKQHQAGLKQERDYQQLAACMIQKLYHTRVAASTRRQSSKRLSHGASQIAEEACQNIVSLKNVKKNQDKMNEDISALRGEMTSLHLKLDAVMRALKVQASNAPPNTPVDTASL